MHTAYTVHIQCTYFLPRIFTTFFKFDAVIYYGILNVKNHVHMHTACI